MIALVHDVSARVLVRNRADTPHSSARWQCIIGSSRTGARLTSAEDPGSPHRSAPACVPAPRHGRPQRCRSRECRSPKGDWSNCRSTPVSKFHAATDSCVSMSPRRTTSDSPSGQKHQMSGTARQPARTAAVAAPPSAVTAFSRKRGADVRSRVDNEVPVRRPCGIDRILLHKNSGGADRRLVSERDAASRDRSAAERLLVRRAPHAGAPCRSSESDTIRGVLAVGLHHVIAASARV